MIPTASPSSVPEVEALQQELQRTRDLLRAVLDASPDPIYIEDTLGRLVQVNAAFRESLQGPAEGDGVGHLRGSAGDDARVFAGEVVSHPNLMVAHADRSLHTYSTRAAPVRSAGGPVWGLVGYARDLTELRRAEEARDQAELSFRDIMDGMLQEAESSFRTLVEALPEAVLVAQEGSYAWVNPAALELLRAVRADQVIGKVPTSLLAPGVAAEFADAMSGRGTSSVARDGHWLRFDGTAVSVEVSAFKGMFDGRLADIVVGRDSTARNELATRMAQMDRLLAVGTLAAGVGHEINNPLAYVVANIDFALGELDGALGGLGGPGRPAGPQAEGLAEMRQALAEAREGAERVRAIVRDLKSFSRVDGDERRPVDLRRILDSAVSMAKPEIRHRAQLVKDYGPVPLVDGNESRLAQVFLNLLINAAHAIPEGRVEQNSIRVAIRTAPDGGAWVEVHDTGSGMAADVLGRVFDPFFTTKPVGQGTGLGLSICQNIVRSFDGEITVESELGRGTVFRVALPGSRLEVAETTPVAPAQVVPNRRGRLLIIDDEAQVAAALARGLGDQHEVEICNQGRAALARLASGAIFDLVFCDLMMPEMTGMEFFERLCAEHPEYRSRVVFVTGGAFTERARQFLLEVPNRRLDKPFDMQLVRDLVQELLNS